MESTCFLPKNASKMKSLSNNKFVKVDLPLVNPCWNVPNDDKKNVDKRFIFFNKIL